MTDQTESTGPLPGQPFGAGVVAELRRLAAVCRDRAERIDADSGPATGGEDEADCCVDSRDCHVVASAVAWWRAARLLERRAGELEAAASGRREGGA